MSKLDELKRTMGANVTESASRRETATPVLSTAPAPGGLSPARLAGVARSKNAMEIPVDRIKPDPDQPREDFAPEALARLAESLRARGQLQPARVRWDEERGAYVIICGERRWRAAKMAGLSTLTCVVSDGALDAGELLALQLIENCVREDLSSMEQARAYRALMDRMGWSGNRLSQELGIDQSSVVKALSLLALPGPIREQVEQGALPASTAYEIGKVEDPAEQAKLAERAVAAGMSRKEVVEAVREVAAGKSAKAKGRGPSKPAKVTSRVFRSPAALVSVELRKGSGAEAILTALRDAMRAMEAELGPAEDQAAA